MPTPVKINNLESRGVSFMPPRWSFFGRAPPSVSSERIQAFIADIDLQARDSIHALTELKEEVNEHENHI